MDSNQSGTVGGIIWGPFQGSLTHLGGPLEGSEAKCTPFLGQILTFPDPPSLQIQSIFYGLLTQV